MTADFTIKELPYLQAIHNTVMDHANKIKKEMNLSFSTVKCASAALVVLSLIALCAGAYLIATQGPGNFRYFDLALIAVGIAFIVVMVTISLKNLKFLKEKSNQLDRLEFLPVTPKFIVEALMGEITSALKISDKGEREEALQKARDFISQSLTSMYDHQKSHPNSNILDTFLGAVQSSFSKPAGQERAIFLHAISLSIYIFEAVDRGYIYPKLASEILGFKREVAPDLSVESVRKGYSKLMIPCHFNPELLHKHPEVVAYFSTKNKEGEAIPQNKLLDCFKSMDEEQKTLFLKALSALSESQLEELKETIPLCLKEFIEKLALRRKFRKETMEEVSKWGNLLANLVKSFWTNASLIEALDTSMGEETKRSFVLEAAQRLKTAADGGQSICNLIQFYGENKLPKLLQMILAKFPEMMATDKELAPNHNVISLVGSDIMTNVEKRRYLIASGDDVKEPLAVEIRRLGEFKLGENGKNQDAYRKEFENSVEIRALLEGPYLDYKSFVTWFLDNKKIPPEYKYPIGLDILEALKDRSSEFISNLDPKRLNNDHFKAMYQQLAAETPIRDTLMQNFDKVKTERKIKI